MVKPRMRLVITDDNERLIRIASIILRLRGYDKKAEEIEQRAIDVEYDFYEVLRLLKEYMDI